MIERRIKELAVACEALSRVNQSTAADQLDRVQHLLNIAIRQAEKELEAAAKQTQPDDDIPF